MIFDELNTAFVFYNDLDKQNRFRKNCEAICNYTLLCPYSTILPFQIKTDPDPSTEITEFQVICAADDMLFYDIDLLGSIDVTTIEDVATYLTFNGGTFKDSIPCGTYYIKVTYTNEEGEFMYYSELFTVMDSLPDPDFAQTIFPVYSAWAWYNNEGKISENNSPCDKVCGFLLMCGNDALLPFQYKVDSATSITSWTLLNDQCTFPLDVSMLSIQTMGDYKNIIYNGDLIDLPCGMFYSQMVIDGVTHYSEPIYISNAFETSGTNYILQEDGDKLLQEDNFGLLHS
jgi:hypothetical protein